jgi:hypothetical protein
MFDLFRSRDTAVRIVLGALMLLVAASMLLYLVPGGPSVCGTRSDDGQIAAEVGGDKITVQEVNARVQSALRNQHIPERLLYVYIPRIVDGLVRERAMAYEARRLGFESQRRRPRQRHSIHRRRAVQRPQHLPALRRRAGHDHSPV